MDFSAGNAECSDGERDKMEVEVAADAVQWQS
jgi:hypothetical protein